MIDWLLQQPVWLIALLAGLLTWGITALGAGLVFFFKKINNKAYALMLGFASGVMIAASVWSLIIPALEHAEDLGYIPWLVAAIGILLGVIFYISLIDVYLTYTLAKDINQKDQKQVGQE